MKVREREGIIIHHSRLISEWVLPISTPALMQFGPHFEIRNNFQMAASLKTEMYIEARGLETSMKNTVPFSEIGTSAKILRWLTPSEGGLLDSLALAWNLWNTWIPVCCFLSSRYGISSYCGFPLLQPVKALEFFQHRILRSKYLNFLEEFFIVFISDIFGKFRKSQQATED